MFDTNEVAGNIKNARTKMNMTQMNLADEMGVSYQAVSNWERGNSMPDISKLPELCKILNISFEELVGERTVETDIAEKLMQDGDADVTLEEMAQVGQLVEPDKIESKVNEVMNKGGKIPFSVLVSLAPFIDKETLSNIVEEMADVNLKKLCAIAPFIKKEAMDRIVDNSIRNECLDVNNIAAIAPFLPKSTIHKVSEYLIEHDQAKKLALIAPFMGKGMFPKLLGNIRLDADEAGENPHFESIELDDLDEDEVANIAFCALEQGRDVAEYLDYMDDRDVVKLSFRALELDKKTELFLDYMDEKDVEKLAFKALKAGKPIECYLDYVDEDALRRLLLESAKK